MPTTRAELIERTIDAILVREGGYVNRLEDRGGPTNFGVTAATLGTWRKLGRPATVEEVRGLTELEARAIYRSRYIERPKFLTIENEQLFAAVVDVGVNCGPWRAIQFLQRALGLEQDGVLGPVTREAIRSAPTGQLYRRFVAERIRYYGRLITGDRTDADRDGVPDSTEFASGWLNRTAEFVEVEV